MPNTARRPRSRRSSRGDLSELLKLRAQVAKLRDDARELAKLKAGGASTDNDPTAAEMKSWLDRVRKLKEKLAQMPERKIPEFQFLTEQDWLDAVKNAKQLETAADYDKALSALRGSAKQEFATMVQGALGSYAQANNGQLPTDMSQLQPYFASSLDDSVAQRYEITQPGTVSEKTGSLIDEDGNYYSSRIQVSGDGISSSTTTEDALHQAIQAFLAANSGQTLTDPSQLMPYVTTPAEQTALQKILKNYAQK
jgi:hypothetical protein